MNNFFNNLIIYNGYPLSVIAALSMHTLVFIAVLYFQSQSEVQALELVQPTVIKALFIDENPQVRNERIQERRQLERQQQQEREREQQRQAEAERQERAREQERQAAEQREQEAQRQAALRERAEIERLREEQLLRERQQQENELRQQREREEAERQRREEENRRQQEAAAQATAEAARNEFELVQSATGLIQNAVQDGWSRPPSARNGMRAILQIRMLPTGDLVDVVITQSSGDPAFDRSAETAVYRAAPFSELQSLPINVFNANFRSLSLIFEPEDLLN